MVNVDRGFVSAYYSLALDNIQCFTWIAAKMDENPNKSHDVIAMEMQSFFSWDEDQMPVSTIKAYFHKVKKHFEDFKAQNRAKREFESLHNMSCYAWMVAKASETQEKTYVNIAKEMQSFFGWTEKEMPTRTILEYFRRVQFKIKKQISENGSIRTE